MLYAMFPRDAMEPGRYPIPEKESALKYSDVIAPAVD